MYSGDPALDLATWMCLADIDITQAARLPALEAGGNVSSQEVRRVELHLAARHLHFTCGMLGHLRPDPYACYFYDGLTYDLQYLNLKCDTQPMANVLYPPQDWRAWRRRPHRPSAIQAAG